MKEYFIDRSYKASMGIANAVLVTLGMGLLLQTIGDLAGLEFLMKIGAIGKNMLIPGIGIGIAICLKANTLVVISAGAAAIIGGGGIVELANGGYAIAGGEPVGAILAVIVAVWTGKRVTGTRFDMILIPAVSLLSGGLSGLLFSKIMTPTLVAISQFITILVSGSPLISSMVIALIFGLLILSPASSAALAIALQLDPTASAAALIGCTVQFATFAILSFRDNNWGAFFAQLIITPKLQTANIIRKPSLMIIPLLITLVAGPLGVLVLHLEATAEIAGMGLCAFVAPLYMIAHYGIGTFLSFAAVAIILPAAVAFIVRPILLKREKLKEGDLRIELE
ncbi:hypothetical protein MFLO_07467 [Listeria floridensis FSL S10-1187]|uniref:Phosphotransferase system EIIC domain-containing protein n=1 Tax=Listeria floridensis FSL S10-1187 TaxID=1265817 RepID=A0ABP3AZ48_9LIST|nr:PTS sugar transporter subunit IIC [Listeria floridensis]EUJ32010.1 hypothetical protein MFLO_07467 [Listeria floridensis FSL S10-1187]